MFGPKIKVKECPSFDDHTEPGSIWLGWDRDGECHVFEQAPTWNTQLRLFNKVGSFQHAPSLRDRMPSGKLVEITI